MLQCLMYFLYTHYKSHKTKLHFFAFNSPTYFLKIGRKKLCFPKYLLFLILFCLPWRSKFPFSLIFFSLKQFPLGMSYSVNLRWWILQVCLYLKMSSSCLYSCCGLNAYVALPLSAPDTHPNSNGDALTPSEAVFGIRK